MDKKQEASATEERAQDAHPHDGDGFGKTHSPTKKTIFDHALGFSAAIAGALLMIMMLIVCYSVLMRYFISKPPVWATEITEYILLFATFLAAAWVLRDGAHVRIDIVVDRLSRKTQRVLEMIACIFAVAACSLLVWHGFKATYSLWGRNVIMMGNLPWPKFLLVSVIPVGILLTLIQLVRMIASIIRGKRSIW